MEEKKHEGLMNLYEGPGTPFYYPSSFNSILSAILA